VAGPDREEHPTTEAEPAPPENGDESAAPEPAETGATDGATDEASTGDSSPTVGDESAKPDPAGVPEGPGLHPTAPVVEQAQAAYNDFEQLKLDVFEGPLDLLLHLIRKHELDILDIPVGFITEKYLEYIDRMRSLHIDVVSEYLVIAATLTHIKSKMLLPPDPSAQDGEDGDLFEADPRADLVRRLLEYQKYKHVAGQLGDRPRLYRDTFTRGAAEGVDAGPAELAPVNVFRLFDAFEHVLKRANQTADHQILFERVSMTERIVELTEVLGSHRRLRFTELFTAKRDGGEATERTRLELVITFLALLEMCKMGVARVSQEGGFEDIFVEFAAKRLAGDAIPEDSQAESTEGAEGAPADPGAAERAADTNEAEADVGSSPPPEDDPPPPEDDPPPPGDTPPPPGEVVTARGRPAAAGGRAAAARGRAAAARGRPTTARGRAAAARGRAAAARGRPATGRGRAATARRHRHARRGSPRR